MDGGNVVAELEDDALSASYLRGANLISRTTSATEYYTFNAHGDVVGLVSAAGTQTKTYDYDAFGNEKDRVGSDLNPFRYCGEYFDVESGAYYLRARYYDPSVGRFTQEDPACAGLNWYTYCNNRPVMFVDPSGLVEVGLREYASTYEGAVVEWDAEKRIATVTYEGKVIRIEATDENLRDGRIYVDDSVFVNKFGIGGKLIVYQDSVTNNVSIRASFSFFGTAAYECVEGSITEAHPGGISYSKAFLMGIEEYWSGDFGEYSVSTYARYSADGIKVSFKAADGVCYVTYPIFTGWSKEKPGKVTMFYGDSRNDNPRYNVDQFKWIAAHEFGHILGVLDAYPDNPGLPTIFNEPAYKYTVQEIDIMMVLLAWKIGKAQEW